MSAEPEFFEVDAQALGLSRGTKWAIALLLSFPLVAGVVARALGGVLGPLVPVVYLALMLIGVVVGAKRKWFGLEPKPGRVSVGRRGVRIDGKLVADRMKVDNAAIVRDDDTGGMRVLLGKKGSPQRSLRLLVKDNDAAHDVLRKLGLDADSSTATWSTLGGAMYSSWGIWAQMSPLLFAVLSIALAAATRSSLFGITAAASFVSFYALLFSKTTVVVGADGVLVKWLHLQRFCPMSEVRFVELLPNGVRLHRAVGDPFDVKLGTEQQVRNDRYRVLTSEIEALYNRVQDALAARNAGADAMVASDPFLRNQRSPREWLAAVKGMFDAVGGLRDAANTEESAWRVVADSAASEEARIGAAAALAAKADERGREKLRAVAENVAATHVRVAIEAAAKGDEDAIVEAMEKVAAKNSEG